MIYYVYSHTRLDTNEVFYIGIGKTHDLKKTNRAYVKANRSKEWQNILLECNNNYRVDILFTYDNKDDCCAKEVELIEKYGRSCLGKGLLVNKSTCVHKWKDTMKVYQYDLDGNFIAEWMSPMLVASVFNITYPTIYAACRLFHRVKNYQFRSYKCSKIDSWQSRSKKVYCFTMIGDFVCEYESISLAAKELGVQYWVISKVLQGKKHSVKNYILSTDRNKCRIRRLILQHSLDGTLIAKYHSLPAVVKALNLKSHNSIDNAIKGIIQNTAYGYKWKEIVNTEIYVD